MKQICLIVEFKLKVVLAPISQGHIYATRTGCSAKLLQPERHSKKSTSKLGLTEASTIARSSPSMEQQCEKFAQ